VPVQIHKSFHAGLSYLVQKIWSFLVQNKILCPKITDWHSYILPFPKTGDFAKLRSLWITKNYRAIPWFTL